MARPNNTPWGQLALALVPLGLTAFFFFSFRDESDRRTLLWLLIAECAALCWLTWKLASPSDSPSSLQISRPAAPNPSRLPEVANNPPLPRAPYVHRPLQTTRPPERRSDPIPTIQRKAPRAPKLPELPTLRSPHPGRQASRPAPTTPRPSAPKPARPVININDLLPPNPTAPTAPKPRATPTAPAPTPTSRPKRPSKYKGFSADSGTLPTTLGMSELQVCSDIMRLGYACAASDGPVSSEEDNHLMGWAWCVIDATSAKDSHAFLQGLTDTAAASKMRGKLKLDELAKIAQLVRATGERKLIQSAGLLCGEIVELDGKLEPGEFATLAVVLKELGVRNLKAIKIAEELIANDEDITEMKEELDIDESTPKEIRDVILSKAWYKENQRMTTVTDPTRREAMRRRMELIQKIRDLYRELDDIR